MHPNCLLEPAVLHTLCASSNCREIQYPSPHTCGQAGTAPGWAERGWGGGSGCQLGAAATQGCRSSSNGDLDRHPLPCKQQSWSSIAVLQHEQLEQPCHVQAWVNAGGIIK